MFTYRKFDLSGFENMGPIFPTITLSSPFLLSTKFFISLPLFVFSHCFSLTNSSTFYLSLSPPTLPLSFPNFSFFPYTFLFLFYSLSFSPPSSPFFPLLSSLSFYFTIFLSPITFLESKHWFSCGI